MRNDIKVRGSYNLKRAFGKVRGDGNSRNDNNAETNLMVDF